MAMLDLDLAVSSDVEALVDLRDDAARWLLDRGIEQWRPGEFTADRMHSWVEQGHVHVLRKRDQLVACVAILWDDPDVWGDDGDEAGYIHLLVVGQGKRGTGLGDAVLRWAERNIHQTGRRLSRLDAVSSNRTLHDWYERRGYAKVGHHNFAEGPWLPVTLREKHLGT